jgi:hypothetical protein
MANIAVGGGDACRAERRARYPPAEEPETIILLVLRVEGEREAEETRVVRMYDMQSRTSVRISAAEAWGASRSMKRWLV